MARKRASCTAEELTDGEEYEYVSPGCYCTPQVLVPNQAAYLHEYLPPWNIYNTTATYIVDAYGMVYYLSDFEHQLQLPSDMTVETEITYHYYDKDDCNQIGDEEQEDVSPRKRERFENEDLDSDSNAMPDTAAEIPKKTSKTSLKSCVYRAKEGYLVEEPNDVETNNSQS